MSATDQPGQRTPQRRTRSRRALIAATQEFLAEGRLDFTALDVAERAEVSVQTLYNHFSSKDDLVAVAYVTGLQEFEADMIARTESLSDPAEALCSRIRMYGRLPDTDPMLARAFTQLSASAAAYPQGYNPVAREDVRAAIDAGRLRCDDVDLALTALVGAFDWLVAVRLVNPAIGVDRVDDMAALFLTILGMPADEAAELAHRPLDEVLASASSP